MANEPQTTTTTAPAAPAPAAPATTRSPAPLTPGASKPGERQAALSAAEQQRRLDRGPRLKGEAPAARDATKAPPDGRSTSGYPYAPEPAGDAPEKIKLADGFEFTPEELTDLRARAALEATRKLTLPAAPTGYKNEFPADFKLPDGVELKLDERDPLLGQYRAFAHEQGFDQSTYSKGLGLVAMIRAQEAIQFQTAFKSEVTKLGAGSAARIDATVQWLTSMAGPEAKALCKVFQLAPVADTVVAVENLMKRFSSQGITPFNTAHRADAPDAGKIPGYDKMSFEQRREAQDRRLAQQRGNR
jgi:hypothetical protein